MEQDSALALQHICDAALNSEGNFSLLQFLEMPMFQYFTKAKLPVSNYRNVRIFGKIKSFKILQDHCF